LSLGKGEFEVRRNSSSRNQKTKLPVTENLKGEKEELSHLGRQNWMCDVRQKKEKKKAKL
jgi:hypothetical protein